MKLIYKGKYQNESQLPTGVLPPNAVKFKEPETPGELNLIASLFALPTILLIAIVVGGSYLLHGQINFQYRYLYFMIGLLLSFLCMFPHEILHAVCFGKEAEVEMYVAPKKMMMFVVSTYPISKMRFIFLSMLPNLVFGWFPLLIWAILPYSGGVSNVLFSFSTLSILLGVGDYMNVFNALRQMPKGSMQQLSGFHSYWFMP